MRLLSDIFIAGILIPRNTFLSGVVSLDNARLQIEVSSIYLFNNIFPVQLSVYDMKGIKGLEIHSSAQAELVRQSTDRTAQGMNITSLNPSIGAQAATAGIEVAKNLMSKKIRQIKVLVAAGQPVLLLSEELINQ